MPDLLSLVLTLKLAEKQPAAEDEERPQPLWWGRAAHALLLQTVQKQDAALAQSLHDEEGMKPFTVSNLLGHRKNGKLVAGSTCSLRFTTLKHPLSELLLLSTQKGGNLAPGSLVELDYLPFEVLAVTTDQHVLEWASAAAYEELAARHLPAEGSAPRRIAFQFTSPTAFNTQGRTQPLPLPRLVFQSLLLRWNAVAPRSFPEETIRFAEECLAISRFQLKSRSVPLKEGGLRMGAVGEVTFATLNYDRYWMGILHTLAEFAFFAGVGAATTLGLGQCRRSTEA